MKAFGQAVQEWNAKKDALRVGCNNGQQGDCIAYQGMVEQDLQGQQMLGEYLMNQAQSPPPLMLPPPEPPMTFAPEPLPTITSCMPLPYSGGQVWCDSY